MVFAVVIVLTASFRLVGSIRVVGGLWQWWLEFIRATSLS